MSNGFTPHVIRFVGLLLMQGLIFNPMTDMIALPLQVFVYPLFILLLPTSLPSIYAVILGFVIGLGADAFENTGAIHAGAGSMSGYVRYLLLRLYEPKGGFTGKELIPSPNWFGYMWFFRLAGIFMAAHVFWFFLLDAFNLVQLGNVIFKSALSWVASMFFGFGLIAVFNPKQ